MSYDVYVGRGSFNYTSNLRRFFHDFGVDPRDFNGMDRHAVAYRIASALEQMRANKIETLRAEYDPPADPITGEQWGNVDGAIEFLKKIHGECVYEIPDKVQVSW